MSAVTLTDNFRGSQPDKLDRYLDTVKCLPPSPGLMIKLIELFRQPDHDVDEIVELMRQDLSVTAELLRRCNSTFFYDEKPVTDVRESVFRLGFYEVYRVTVTLLGRKAMSPAEAAGTAEMDALWRHSLITAMTAGALARHLAEQEGSAFTAGLLHDVGKIILAQAEAPDYWKILQKYGHFGESLAKAEKKAFGFEHGEIGARLLNRWGVPASIVLPVLNHHKKDWPEPFTKLEAIVSLANIMSHCIERYGCDKCCELPEAQNAMAALGLDIENKLALEDVVRNELNSVGPLLGAGCGTDFKFAPNPHCRARQSNGGN